MSDIDWERIPKKRRAAFKKKLNQTAGRVRNIDYTKPARSSLPVKMKFYMVRMLQTGLGKTDPEYSDYKYWKKNPGGEAMVTISSETKEDHTIYRISYLPTSYEQPVNSPCECDILYCRV